MHLSEFGLPETDVAALKKKNIYTVNDLLLRFPRLYRDYRKVMIIGDCKPDNYCAVQGTLVSTDVRKGASSWYLRLSFLSGGRSFDADMFLAGSSFYVRKQYLPYVGKELVMTGKVSYDTGREYYMLNPEITPKEEFIPGIRTIYPKNGTMPQDHFDFWVRKAMEGQGEILEEEIRRAAGLMPYREALACMHYPRTVEEIEKARKQFVFYDLLWFEICRNRSEAGLPQETSVRFTKTGKMKDFVNQLPFPMTALDQNRKNGSPNGGQKDVLMYLAEKAASGRRIEAVIEGDVGCGKTVVAGALAVLAAENGYQAAVVAPKVVLAKQHAEEISGWCSALGISYEIVVGIPKNAKERKERAAALKRIKSGESRVIIGTRAAFSESAEYSNLGLVIIDEEQQLGVDQKNNIRRKALPDAHYIEMSATPVPRSLAMAIYGSREVCRITKKPAGRKRVLNARGTYDGKDILKAFVTIRKQLDKGRQCYVVVPMVNDNKEAGIDGIKKTAARYEKCFAPLGYRVVTADGKMSAKAFNESIEAFKENRAQILVATTVVEVGVNVPNASVIVIENADRFGLAQMHQLRGRVGRREYDSYCIMLTDDRENERVETMLHVTDGFEIAEKDMLLRGSGDVNGSRQSGQDKYITEAILYPDIHKKAKETALLCDGESKNGHFLSLAYKEHLKYEESED